MNQLGIVAIGRNEGERLRRCLESVIGRGQGVVYVDSNSTDESVELARTLGVEVVQLDSSRPFTAAWARNQGIARLLEIFPETRFVQVVDGDCEVVEGWLDRACSVMEEQSAVAVVCGRRRERFPDRTIYHHLADLEWDTPIGIAKACGGDALFRIEAFRQVGGYNPTLISGEESELCVRLRRAGWTILRIDAEMTLHDVAMTQFGQWWKRSVRPGHAFIEGAAMHGARPERHFVRETCSIILWGIVFPLAALALAWPTKGLSLALLIGYPLLFARAYRYYLLHRGWSSSDSRLYASAAILAKFPQAVGVLIYLRRRLLGLSGTWIEYKVPASQKVDDRILVPSADPRSGHEDDISPGLDQRV